MVVEGDSRARPVLISPYSPLGTSCCTIEASERRGKAMWDLKGKMSQLVESSCYTPRRLTIADEYVPDAIEIAVRKGIREEGREPRR